MSLTPHDMAKIGWLYLNNGRWGDQQLVPEKWVTDSTRKHINATLFDGYGYQWWVTPGKYYAAVGYNGQFIFVVPDKNMVAVFTSVLDQVDFFIPEELLNRYVIPAVVSDNPLPENASQAVRLKGLIDKCGESLPYVWHTEAEGVAVDSQFRRTAEPAFIFTYPPGAFKLELDPTLPNQIMTMRTQDEHPVFRLYSRRGQPYSSGAFWPELLRPVIGAKPQNQRLGRRFKQIHCSRWRHARLPDRYQMQIWWFPDELGPGGG
jgi:hypothetical protein